ncbi:MAG TPA: hypothetical protein VMT15_22460 [Bryobacteraceae bacterium]|nr:hypothetical protein [Bryobacteraceae bacterium]
MVHEKIIVHPRGLAAQYTDSSAMPCLLLLLALAFPRVVIVLMYLFSDYLERAYHSLLLIVVGFFFLPLTTIVYAWIVNSHHAVEGPYLVAVIVCVLADLGLIGQGASRTRRSN